MEYLSSKMGDGSFGGEKVNTDTILEKPDLNKPAFKAMPEAKENVQKGICPTCKGRVGAFRDKSSEREYGISGMCQKCQDSVFGDKPYSDDLYGDMNDGGFL